LQSRRVYMIINSIESLLLVLDKDCMTSMMILCNDASVYTFGL
jgi:hypothetical protein